jgi:NAD+ kinase
MIVKSASNPGQSTIIAGMSAEKTRIARIAVAAQPNSEQAFEEAAAVAAYASELGLEAAFGRLGDEEIERQVSSREIDLLVTLGGDGSMLRAGHLCAPFNVPILGINHGRLGFLIEVPPDGWRERLPQLLAGDYWLERRMMLRTELWRGGECLGKWETLNEAFVGRGDVARPAHLAAHLDGRRLTTYVVDGLIIATPTGSTAYALAAGGPILPPELRNILIVPVAPHLSVDRAIVLAEGANVSVEVQSGPTAILSVDGRESVDVQHGDLVKVCASDHTVQFLRFQEPEYFYRHLIALMDQNPSAGEPSS